METNLNEVEAIPLLILSFVFPSHFNRVDTNGKGPSSVLYVRDLSESKGVVRFLVGRHIHAVAFDFMYLISASCQGSATFSQHDSSL